MSRNRKTAEEQVPLWPLDDPVAAVFASYKQHHPGARLDAKRRDLIRARLADGFTPRDLADAIDGCHRSPFHLGENDRGRRYTELGLILRDADHVERFMDVPQVPVGAEGGTVVSSIRMLEARKRREQQAS